jgi:hypothetical protein
METLACHPHHWIGLLTVCGKCRRRRQQLHSNTGNYLLTDTASHLYKRGENAISEYIIIIIIVIKI